nr:acyl-CoA dehydrogenase family protein [Desulfobotulus pelophilus]
MAADFGKETLKAFPDIASSHPFPREVWKNAGEKGILGIGLPTIFGGQGGSFHDISAAAAEISFSAACPGLALSILLHHMIGAFIIKDFGTKKQQQTLLPPMARGEICISLAISEPGTGASPKGIRSLAEKTPEGWQISGNKTFITNAALADLFAVMVITGENKGRKEFSTFLIPRQSKGLCVKDMGPLPFLRPAPHGEISLGAVSVSDSALLGKPGYALNDMAKPFRGLEDALMAGAVAGGLAALLQRCCRDIGKDPADFPGTTDIAGLNEARIAALASLASRAAASSPPSAISERINRAIRDLSRRILEDLRTITKDRTLRQDTKTLFMDLEKSGTIAAGAAAVRQHQAGERLFQFS